MLLKIKRKVTERGNLEKVQRFSSDEYDYLIVSFEC